MRSLPSLFVALALAAAAPPGGTEEPPAFTDAVEVGWVEVPVVVRRGPHPVTDLEPGDFRLYVDGRPVPFDSFDQGGGPVQVVILQDLSGSMGPAHRLEWSGELAGCLLDKALPGDRYSIASFAGGRAQVDIPFTDELQPLREAIALWEASGTTALHDAVSWLPRIVLEGNALKRAVVLLTDGSDNASTVDAVTAREVVRRTEVPIYVIGLGSGSPYDLTTDGEKLHRHADVLNLLGVQTGGGYHPISTREQLAPVCQALTDEIRHQYLLGFQTQGLGQASDRTIHVEVRARNADVAFRRGYHGRAPDG